MTSTTIAVTFASFACSLALLPGAGLPSAALPEAPADGPPASVEADPHEDAAGRSGPVARRLTELTDLLLSEGILAIGFEDRHAIVVLWPMRADAPTCYVAHSDWLTGLADGEGAHAFAAHRPHTWRSFDGGLLVVRGSLESFPDIEVVLSSTGIVEPAAISGDAMEALMAPPPDEDDEDEAREGGPGAIDDAPAPAAGGSGRSSAPIPSTPGQNDTIETCLKKLKKCKLLHKACSKTCKGKTPTGKKLCLAVCDAGYTYCFYETLLECEEDFGP